MHRLVGRQVAGAVALVCLAAIATLSAAPALRTGFGASARPADRLQLVGARIGPKHVPDTAAAAAWADRSDWLQLNSGFSPAIIQAFRRANPKIILIAHDMSVSNQTWNNAEFPDSWYVKDRTSNEKIFWVDKAWQLDISRADVRQNRVAAVKAKVDAYDAEWAYIDIAGPDKYTKPPWAPRWMRDEGGKPADLGDWPGLAGRFQALQLQWHRELRTALGPSRMMMWNGAPVDPSWYEMWKTKMNEYLTIGGGPLNGLQFEVFAYNSGPLPEAVWRAEIFNIRELVDQGIYVMCGPIEVKAQDSDWARRYIFGSYLLIADGRYALLGVRHPNWTAGYNPELHGLDLGTAMGVFQIIPTSGGPVYKRRFTKLTVWVNPGSNVRVVDEKSIPPHDAVFER